MVDFANKINISARKKFNLNFWKFVFNFLEHIKQQNAIAGSSKLNKITFPHTEHHNICKWAAVGGIRNSF